MTITHDAPTTATAMPASPETEGEIIASLLLGGTAGDVILAELTAADFYVPTHQAVFEAAARLYERDVSIDPLAVIEELRAGGDLAAVGGDAGLIALLDRHLGSGSNLNHYIEVLQSHRRRRQLLRAAFEIRSQALDETVDADAALENSAELLETIGEDRGDAPEAIGRRFAEVINRIEEPDPGGVPTGLRDLDRRLGGGLGAGQLVVIAGRPSMGKSILAQTIAANVAGGGGAVVMFSLEMTNDEIAERLLSSAARVDIQRLKQKMRASKQASLDDGQVEAYAKLQQAANKHLDLPLFVDQTSSPTPLDIRARSRRIQRQYGLSLVVIDYLQLMTMPGRHETREREVATISRLLKGLATDLGVPVVAVSQLNRGVETRNDKRPTLADLRESGSIEQDADKVLLLYRDDYYNPESTQAGVAEVHVAKNRQGETGRVDCTFVPETSLFVDMG